MIIKDLISLINFGSPIGAPHISLVKRQGLINDRVEKKDIPRHGTRRQKLECQLRSAFRTIHGEIAARTTKELFKYVLYMHIGSNCYKCMLQTLKSEKITQNKVQNVTIQKVGKGGVSFQKFEN